MMYRVEMRIDGEWYEFGTYRDRNRANQAAEEVRDERGCWVQVIEVE